MRISDWSSDVCSSDLTGAMIISLGNEYAGIFANDDGLADDLIAAGKASGDQLWRFPLGDAYNKLIDSPIADMKNIGPRYGDRKSTRLNSSHSCASRMPSSA